MTVNQLKGNLNGCREQTKPEDGGIDGILEELMAYVCDELCWFREEMQGDLMDRICRRCGLQQDTDRIREEYDRINSFDHSQAVQLMNKYKNIVLCEECEDRWYSKADKTSYCCSEDGICRVLEPGEGCSCGRRKE